jgi:hypothetical protein
MGSKGGGTTESTVTQNRIPEEFYPYFERMLTRGEALSNEPYIPYGGQRLADQTGDTLASQQMVRDLSNNGSPGLDMATGMTAQNAAMAQGMAGAPSYEFSPYSGYAAGQANPYSGFQEAGYSEFDFSPTQQFDGAAAAQYMSPYMQNVVDIQKSQAGSDYLIAQNQRNAQAIGAGAFGGSRQAVSNAMAERDLLSRTGEIQATGLQSAYTDAQRMFESDRNASFANQQAQAGERGRVQAGTAGEMGRVQQAQAAELARTQGISLEEAARIQSGQAGEFARVQSGQSAENLGRDNLALNALGQSSSMANQLAALSEQARSGDIQAAQLLEIMGRSNEARTQAELDLGYEDFNRQRDYPMSQLQQLSAMINGLPVGDAGTTSTSVPYNPVQQALGMGISALGLYKGMQ